MAIEIPIKKKYRPQRVWYGYRRNNNGNGKRAKKNAGFGNGYSDPYIRENHILLLTNGRKRVWLHK